MNWFHTEITTSDWAFESECLRFVDDRIDRIAHADKMKTLAIRIANVVFSGLSSSLDSSFFAK